MVADEQSTVRQLSRQQWRALRSERPDLALALHDRILETSTLRLQQTTAIVNDLLS